MTWLDWQGTRVIDRSRRPRRDMAENIERKLLIRYMFERWPNLIIGCRNTSKYLTFDSTEHGPQDHVRQICAQITLDNQTPDRNPGSSKREWVF